MTAHPPGMVLVLILAAPALAGCLGEQGGPDPDASVVPALSHYLDDEFPVEWDHTPEEHADPTLHHAALSLDLAGYHSCAPDGAYAAGRMSGFTDLAFHGPHLFAGHSAGFCVLDIADPTRPRYVGEYRTTNAAASDLEVSADGNHVFFTTQRNKVTQSSVTTPGSPPRGVHVVDVTDKARPVFESYYPVPTNGVHTASAFATGGRQFVFVQSYDWVPPKELNDTVRPPPFPETNAPLTQRIEITELVAGPDGTRALVRVATYSFPRPPTDQLVYYFPHDSFAQVHPLTGRTYLYVAYWDAGLVVVDITDPLQPRLVSQYDDRTPSLYNNYHDVKASEVLIDGRHITVTAPEIEVGRETGVVRVFDTTDPARPVQLGTWRLPGGLGVPKDFLFSPHVFAVHAGRIYIGHNHGGVWVIDISTPENLRQPKSAGFFFPHGDTRLGPAAWANSTRVWGAYWHEGYVYATEAASGVHVLRFGGDPGPKA